MHAAGIVHRDLKPSNLFVTRRADGAPCVKLLDFGISKLTDAGDEADDPALTATATIMGTPAYMSPEQLRSTKEVDARSDVWSLGAVLYEAVTGRGAFRRETVPQVCAMIASEEPAPPSSLRANLPATLERAILGCLHQSSGAAVHAAQYHPRGRGPGAGAGPRVARARGGHAGQRGLRPKPAPRPRPASHAVRAIAPRSLSVERSCPAAPGGPCCSSWRRWVSRGPPS